MVLPHSTGVGECFLDSVYGGPVGKIPHIHSLEVLDRLIAIVFAPLAHEVHIAGDAILCHTFHLLEGVQHHILFAVFVVSKHVSEIQKYI